MYQTIDLKTAPEVLRVIRAVDPSYRKHKAMLKPSETVAISGTYWDGGSRSSYTAVDLRTYRVVAAPQYDPPQFGGPRQNPTVAIPEGIAIVQTGTFCGKTAAAVVWINPANMARLIQ